MHRTTLCFHIAGRFESHRPRRCLSSVLFLFATATLLGYYRGPMGPTRLDVERLPSCNGNQTVLHLKGKLALETVHDFIQTARPDPSEHLILDLSGVSFLDSAGAGALVQLFVHRRNKGQTFALGALSTQSSAVMQVAGLTKLLPIYASLDEAIAAKK